jgi:hypothetical protein
MKFDQRGNEGTPQGVKVKVNIEDIANLYCKYFIVFTTHSPYKDLEASGFI